MAEYKNRKELLAENEALTAKLAELEAVSLTTESIDGKGEMVLTGMDAVRAMESVLDGLAEESSEVERLRAENAAYREQIADLSDAISAPCKDCPTKRESDTLLIEERAKSEELSAKLDSATAELAVLRHTFEQGSTAEAENEAVLSPRLKRVIKVLRDFGNRGNANHIIEAELLIREEKHALFRQ